MRSQARGAAPVLLAAALLVLVPTQARGEGLFTAFAGSTFGGDSKNGTGTFGVALAASAAGVLGIELDLATTSNPFGDDADVVDSSVTTVMGNLVVGIGGPVRPYATGGVGVIRTSVEGLLGSATSSDFGMNFGGGVTGFFSNHVGLRGDVRFFRSVGDSSDLVDLDIDNVDFWRATIGAAVRW